MTKIIEEKFENKAYLRAYLIEGSQDLIAMEFHSAVYPDIRHFEFEETKDLISTIIEYIVNSDNNSLLFIETLQVDDEYQGQGVGTEVVTGLLEETSAEMVMLIASPIGESRNDVEEIVEFYEKFGLEKILNLKDDVGFLMISEQ